MPPAPARPSLPGGVPRPPPPHPFALHGAPPPSLPPGPAGSPPTDDVLSLYPDDSASALLGTAPPPSAEDQGALPSSAIFDPPQDDGLRSDLLRALEDSVWVIARVLSPEMCLESPPLKRKVSAFVDAPHLARRPKSLPQPPSYRDLKDAFNSHLKSTLPEGHFFLADRKWPVDVDMFFRQQWYAGHSQAFLCPLPPIDGPVEVQAGGKSEARRLTPRGLDRRQCSYGTPWFAPDTWSWRLKR